MTEPMAVQYIPYPDVSTGILLSTLWSQYGIISIGDNTTVAYDEYTPIDPETSQHSYTGCTNTASSQIIHYFIEQKGLELSLHLTADDAYTSNKDGIIIDINADGSTPGTLSFAEVNDRLSAYDPNSATDIATLIYACGVVSKADYSSQGTSTAWYEDLFYRAGFQSVILRYFPHASTIYYWGTTDASGTFTISEGGYEVLIENLQAGCPVGAGIPGHAVVIDGYDGAKDLFHINYGWGDDTTTH